MTIPDDALETFKPKPYAQISKLVQDGDLLLCQGDDAFSKLICWSTGSPWSHIAIAFRIDSLDEVIVIESVENIGVRAVSLAQFCSRNSGGVSPYPGKILLARHNAYGGGPEDPKIRKMARFAFDHLGDKFAPNEISKIGLRIAQARMFGKTHTPNMLIPDDEFICSEFVAKAFEAAKVKIPWDGLGFIAPCDFAADPNVVAVAQVDVSKPPIPDRKKEKKAKPKKAKAGKAKVGKAKAGKPKAK
jgi:hypothetical protein